MLTNMNNMINMTNITNIPQDTNPMRVDLPSDLRVRGDPESP